MKRTFTLWTFVFLFTGLFSCSKKDEPTPTSLLLHSPSHIYDNTADIATIKSAHVVIKAPAGSIVQVINDRNDRPIKILGAAEGSGSDCIVGTNGLLGINGDLGSLIICSDYATEISLTKPLPSLRGLEIRTIPKVPSYHKIVPAKIDLSGATELVFLHIGHYSVESLDLTKQDKLKTLIIGEWQSLLDWSASTGETHSKEPTYWDAWQFTNRSCYINEIKFSDNNSIETLSLCTTALTDDKFDIDNLPKLKMFLCWSQLLQDFTLAKSRYLEKLYLYPPENLALNLNLGPNLHELRFPTGTLMLPEIVISKISISNNSDEALLEEMRKRRAVAEAIEFDNINLTQAIDYIKFVARYPHIPKSITLKNMPLTEALLLDLISNLSERNGTFKVKGELLTTAVNAALSAKGWTGTAL